MSPIPTVRRFKPDEWRTYRDLRLRALAESPDAFGSTLELESARPDGDWERRLEAGARSPTDLPLVSQIGEEPIGLAWGRFQEAEPEAAHLFQVWVAPEGRGLGAGRGLLHAVVAWAREAGARHVLLGVTTCGDGAAVRLYSRAGFRPVGDPQPLRPASPVLTQPMRLELGHESPAPAKRGARI